MAVQFVSATLATSSTPQPIFPNPFPSAEMCLYMNMTGTNVMAGDIVVDAGVGMYFTSTSNVISDALGNAQIQIPPNYTDNFYLNYVYTDPTTNGFYLSSDNPQMVQVSAMIYPSSFSGSVIATQLHSGTGAGAQNLLAQNVWAGTAVTDSSGEFSIDVSSAGFNTVLSAHATAMGTGGQAATSVPLANLTTISTTQVVGSVVTVGVLGPVFVGSGITIQVTVVGY